MKMKLLPLVALTALASVIISASPYKKSALVEEKLEGRWDMTLTIDGKPRPSWLEVQHSGIKTLVGYFVGTGGSARPVSKINFNAGKFNFTIPPQWDEGNDMVIEGELQGDRLVGTVLNPDGKTVPFTAVRAPELRRISAPKWGKPITLFNGKDLTGWVPLGPNNQWVVENGILRNPKSGVNLRTEKTFEDFKLHVEVRIPKESNSGIYLRGRYEIQITDSKGQPPSSGLMGGIYGFIKPSDNMAKDAGEWNVIDAILIGRMVTLTINGKTIITNQEIPGITGGALDSNEGEPGPIYFQGDHGAVEYRNIVITPAQ
jgi:hypothetical protein